MKYISTITDYLLLLFVRTRRGVKHFFSKPGWVLFRPPDESVAVPSYLEELEMRIGTLERKLTWFNAIPSIVSAMNDAEVPSDIQLDLIRVYLNPDQLMTGLCFPEFISRISSGKPMRVIRSLDKDEITEQCANVMAFRTVKHGTSMDDHKEWNSELTNIINSLGGGSVMQIALFDDYLFREWYLIWPIGTDHD